MSVAAAAPKACAVEALTHAHPASPARTSAQPKPAHHVEAPLVAGEARLTGKRSTRKRCRRSERAVGALVHAHAPPPEPAGHVKVALQHRPHVRRAAERLKQRQQHAQQVPGQLTSRLSASCCCGLQAQSRDLACQLFAAADCYLVLASSSTTMISPVSCGGVRAGRCSFHEPGSGNSSSPATPRTL